MLLGDRRERRLPPQHLGRSFAFQFDELRWPPGAPAGSLSISALGANRDVSSRSRRRRGRRLRRDLCDRDRVR
ncbi:MAG: hypothetical protein MZV64_73730 [Ignavibacteriales bacterium]|nr:hypothetical protein [Ignavibacteriales bacterium]